MDSTSFRIFLVAAAALPITATAAAAEDKPGGLPGVDGNYSVVQPAPEPLPEPDAVAEDSPYGEGFYRVPGTDTYIKLSGLVRYDIEYVGKNRK